MKSGPLGVLSGEGYPFPEPGTGLDDSTSLMILPFRCQEKPLTPSRRQLPAGDSPPSPQSLPTHRGQDPQCTSSGKRENRNAPELPRGRIPTPRLHEETDSQGTHARAPTPQRLRTPEATAKGTPARGPSPPPRYSSLAKPMGPGQPPRGEAEGTSSQFREPASVHSPSPVKGPTKIPICLLNLVCQLARSLLSVSVDNRG